MVDVNDMDLLRDYAERHSEAAFADLVRRHINLVYSVALRFAGTDSSPGMEIVDASLPSPDLEFDHEWAVTLLARALERLGREQAEAGKGEQFPVLKPWLTGDKQELSLADLAARLGVSEGALRVALHRLRKRFRELVKEEIAGTVKDSTHVREEMGYLLEVLSQR
jgi:RNA polymerase sigma-70 factor (ECF subfamily)